MMNDFGQAPVRPLLLTGDQGLKPYRLTRISGADDRIGSQSKGIRKCAGY